MRKWFIAVPVPNLEKFQFQIQTFLAQFFDNKKLGQNLAFSMLETALYPRKLVYNILFLDFCILDRGINPVPEPEPECITVAVPLR